jgi:transposase-like protein
MGLKNSNMNRIGLELKAKILAESMECGAVISLVAKKYNISKGTIYNWMKQHSLKVPIDKQFVELSIEETSPYMGAQIAAASTLRSAILTWNDLSLKIEGKIMSSQILEIIKILGNKPC